MENKHSDLPFPKKYFGCLMAIFLEQEAITQDRIEELTRYSKTTISQMLKILQMNLPIKKLKQPGIRKKYYSIDINPREFMLKILLNIMSTYQERTDFFLPLIEEIQPHAQKHPKFETFKKFLEDYYYFSALYIQLLEDTSSELSKLVLTGQINSSQLPNYDLLTSPEYQREIQKLMNPPSSPKTNSAQIIRDPELAALYNQFKQTFFLRLRENLFFQGSQNSIARAIIGTELLLEQRPLTQKEIEETTNFQRSTISGILNLLIRMKMIELVKKPGDRKKYYQIYQSWDKRAINRIRLNVIYAREIQGKINHLLEKMERENMDKETSSFALFLKEILHTYVQFEQYFKLLEVKYLNVRLNTITQEKQM